MDNVPDPSNEVSNFQMTYDLLKPKYMLRLELMNNTLILIVINKLYETETIFSTFIES